MVEGWLGYELEVLVLLGIIQRLVFLLLDVPLHEQLLDPALIGLRQFLELFVQRVNGGVLVLLVLVTSHLSTDQKSFLLACVLVRNGRDVSWVAFRLEDGCRQQPGNLTADLVRCYVGDNVVHPLGYRGQTSSHGLQDVILNVEGEIGNALSGPADPDCATLIEVDALCLVIYLEHGRLERVVSPAKDLTHSRLECLEVPRPCGVNGPAEFDELGYCRLYVVLQCNECIDIERDSTM